MSVDGSRPRNLLDMLPVRRREWRTRDDGRIEVLVPRYGDSRLGRWFARSLGRQHIRVNLDRIGSAIWLACDGRTTAGEIALDLERRFGEEVDPVHDRLVFFFGQMDRGALIAWRDPVSPDRGASAGVVREAVAPR